MGFVRYTCNKKNESAMREDCKNCSEYNPCAKDGKWCFVGALVAESGNVNGNKICRTKQDIAMPIVRDMSTVTIHFGNGQSVDVLREDIRKSIEEDFIGLKAQTKG